MTTEDKEKFEQGLAERGYKKITQAKSEGRDDYEYYKAFYKDDEDAEHLRDATKKISEDLEDAK